MRWQDRNSHSHGDTHRHDIHKKETDPVATPAPVAASAPAVTTPQKGTGIASPAAQKILAEK